MNLSGISLFNKNIEQFSMNRKIDVSIFEPEPTFEKTIDEIKYIHLKSITNIIMNVLHILQTNPLHLLKSLNPISYHGYSCNYQENNHN